MVVSDLVYSTVDKFHISLYIFSIPVVLYNTTGETESESKKFENLESIKRSVKLAPSYLFPPIISLTIPITYDKIKVREQKRR